VCPHRPPWLGWRGTRKASVNLCVSVVCSSALLGASASSAVPVGRAHPSGMHQLDPSLRSG
jgi:hypothetical protein